MEERRRDRAKRGVVTKTADNWDLRVTGKGGWWSHRSEKDPNAEGCMASKSNHINTGDQIFSVLKKGLPYRRGVYLRRGARKKNVLA